MKSKQNFKVLFTDNAKTHLVNELERYQSNRKLKILNEVDRLIKNLSTFPLAYRTIKDIDGIQIRKAYIKPFNIFYSVDISASTIYIYKIRHYRQQYK